MDWKKAKKIMISILVILNIGLLYLNFKTVSKYHVNPQREKEISEILSKNGIGLYTELISSSPPMRSLSVKSNKTDTSELKTIFFNENENVKISVLFDKTILSSDTKLLTIEGDLTSFVSFEGIYPPSVMSYAEAKKSVDNFKNKSTFFDKYKIENVTKTDTGYIFQYFEEFDKHKVFGSYAKFHVTEKGIEQIEITNYNIEGYTGDKNNIFACDEALLTFLKEVKDNSKSGIFIEKIELGYDFTGSGTISKDSILKLEPCYYIYVSNSDTPYIINAYTNKMIK